MRVEEQWWTGMGGLSLLEYTGNGLYVGYELSFLVLCFSGEGL